MTNMAAAWTTACAFRWRCSRRCVQPGRRTSPCRCASRPMTGRSEEHTSELQSHSDLVCRLLLEKKKKLTHHRDCKSRVRRHAHLDREHLCRLDRLQQT